MRSIFSPGKAVLPLTLAGVMIAVTSSSVPAAESCKAKVLKTGEIQVAAKNVTTNPRWGTTLANISMTFSNEGTCYDPVDLKLSKCNLAAPATLAGVTMPATCQICVGDDSANDCCVRIKKCTPGIRVRDGSFAAGDPRFEAFEVPDSMTIRVSGVNLQVVNGAGSTAAAPNGKGNLIIGYNEQNLPPKARTGSHNLVVGMDHGWSSTGGFVAGNDNNVTGLSATVIGGYSNVASGSHAAVSGGQGNTAGGAYSSVSGGGLNYASGLGATVSGGQNNSAYGSFASVSGGYANQADGATSSISGGGLNYVTATSGSVTGGYSNVVLGSAANGVVTGGASNAIYGTGFGDTITGGTANNLYASGSANVIGGGTLVQIGGASSTQFHADRAAGFPTGTSY